MSKYKLYFRLHIFYLILSILFVYVGVATYSLYPNDGFMMFFYIVVCLLLLATIGMFIAYQSSIDDLRRDDFK